MPRRSNQTEDHYVPHRRTRSRSRRHDHGIRALLRGEEPRAVATWNAVCLTDFGDEGIAFVAQPQIPPRNVNWSSQGKWVHAAKVGFEKYFLHKVRQGKSETFYEGLALDILGIKKLKAIHVEPAE